MFSRPTSLPVSTTLSASMVGPRTKAATTLRTQITVTVNARIVVTHQGTLTTRAAIIAAATLMRGSQTPTEATATLTATTEQTRPHRSYSETTLPTPATDTTTKGVSTAIRHQETNRPATGLSYIAGCREPITTARSPTTNPALQLRMTYQPTALPISTNSL